MIDKWKLALKEFLKDYEEDDDVIGALLCGSYATGNNDEASDIDVHLILKDSCNYSEKGVSEVQSYLIEYFKNPKYKLIEYLELNHEKKIKRVANMLAYGKIIYDLDGSVKELQDMALEYIDKPLEIITDYEINKNNYKIWDLYDELKQSLKENSPRFNIIYYELLGNIYDFYSAYLSIPRLPKTKLYKILTDNKFREKYHVFKLPDKEFIRLYLICYENDRVNTMFKNMSNLVDYYYTKLGGFNIKQYKEKNIYKED